MNRQLKTILLLLTFALCANAQQALDSIKNMLLNAPVQEKSTYTLTTNVTSKATPSGIKPTWCVPTASHTRT